MSDLNKPKNRLPTTLPVCDLRVAWDGGELAADPNQIGEMACDGDYPLGAPFLNRPSDLSGRPSYLFKCDDLEIALTFEELDRLCRRALKPTEFKKLMAKFGSFHEIHDDFYWPDTGQRAQPMPKGPGLARAIERLGALEERKRLEASLPSAARAPSASL